MQVTNGRAGFLAYETRFWFPSEQCLSFSPFYYSYEVREFVSCLAPAHCRTPMPSVSESAAECCKRRASAWAEVGTYVVI